MCGIAGWYAKKNLPAKKYREKLENLFFYTETRGRDATGIAYVSGENELTYFKAPLTASKFLETEAMKKLLGQEWLPGKLILHCRAATKGSEKNNDNNHPFCSEKLGFALIHNGVISNDDNLTKKYNLVRKARTDSEVMVPLIEKFYDENKNFLLAIKRCMEEVEGNKAVAILTAGGNLYLIKGNSASLVLGYDVEDDVFYFASTQVILSSSVEEYDYIKEFFKVKKSNILIEEVPSERILAIKANMEISQISFKEKERRFVGQGKLWSLYRDNDSIWEDNDDSSNKWFCF